MKKTVMMMGLVGMVLMGCGKQDTIYTANMTAIEVTGTGCLLEDESGECFYWEYEDSEKPLEKWQTVTVIMDSMGTENVFDDEIVSFQ